MRTPGASPSSSRCSSRRTAAAPRSTSTTSRCTSVTSAPPVASISRTRSTAAMSRPRSTCCTVCSLRRAPGNRSRCTRCRSWRRSSYHYQRLLRLDDPVDRRRRSKRPRRSACGQRGRRAVPARGVEAAGDERAARSDAAARAGRARPTRLRRDRRADGDGRAGGAAGGLDPPAPDVDRGGRREAVRAADEAQEAGEAQEARRRGARIRRDWRRAAAFLWMTPLDAALPSRFCATRTRSSASSAPWRCRRRRPSPASSARSARPCCGRGGSRSGGCASSDS